jgi:hypothetical protein
MASCGESKCCGPAALVFCIWARAGNNALVIIKTVNHTKNRDVFAIFIRSPQVMI